MASMDRTAYPRFKRVVPVRELNEAFTPTADEVAWAVDRSLGDSNLLSLVVLLKSYQRLGYFPNITDVPASVVEHIRGELGLAIGVDRASEAERTLKRQRDLVREHLGVVYEPKRVLQVAEAAIRKAVQTKDNPPDLVNVALEELVRGRCELPGYSTLDRLAATIRTEVNSGLFDTVAARLDHAARSKLESLLLVDPASRRSEFDNLKSWAQAPAPSLGKFRARLLHLQGPTHIHAGRPDPFCRPWGLLDVVSRSIRVRFPPKSGPTPALATEIVAVGARRSGHLNPPRPMVPIDELMSDAQIM
jgi:hypothetical protein